MRKIVILFALLMIVVFIIYKNSSNNNEKRTVNKHSQILFPLVKTKKEGKQIPKRVRKISKNEKRMNQQELSIFIQDELKDFFPEILHKNIQAFIIENKKFIDIGTPESLNEADFFFN